MIEKVDLDLVILCTPSGFTQNKQRLVLKRVSML